MQISQNDKANVTLTSLLQGLQGDNVDQAKSGKSLRLHIGKNGADDRLNVHTKTDSIFNNRAQRRQNAVALVKQGICKEFGVSDAKADQLMKSVLQRTNLDRISLADLQTLGTGVKDTLKNEYIGRAKQELGLTDKQSTALYKELAQLPQSEIPTTLDQLKALVPSRGEFEHLHGNMLEVMLGEKPTLDQQSLSAAAKLKTALDGGVPRTVLQKAGLLPEAKKSNAYVSRLTQLQSEGDLSKLEVLAKKLDSTVAKEATFSSDPATQKNVTLIMHTATKADTKSLMTEVDAAISKLTKTNYDVQGKAQVTQRITDFSISRASNKTAPHTLDKQQRQNFESSGIKDQLSLGDANWKIAHSGTGGAIIVSDPSTPQKSAVIKFEGGGMGQAAVDLSKFMASTMEKMDKGGAAGFETSTVVKVDTSDKAVTDSFRDKLKSLEQSPDGNTQLKAERHLKELDTNLSKLMMTKQTKIDGVDLNRLPPQDKVALLRSPQFAQDLGEVMVMGRVFGLSDHLPINPIGGSAETFSPGNVNVSNLMLSKETGKLVLIDLTTNTTTGQPLHGQPTQRYGFKDSENVTAFKVLAEFAASLKDGPSITHAINEALKLGQQTPISTTLKGMLEPGPDSFVGSRDSFVPDELSDKDKQKFVANLMLGALKAMDRVSANAQEIADVGKELANSGAQFFDNPDKTMTDIATQIGTANSAQAQRALQDFIQQLG